MPTSIYKFFFGFLKSLTFYIMICYSFTTQGDCKIFNFKSLNAPFFWVEMYCPCQKYCTFVSQYKNKSCVWFFGCYFVIEMFNTIVSIKCALHQFKKINFCFDDKYFVINCKKYYQQLPLLIR